jgi:hypothetical protein
MTLSFTLRLDRLPPNGQAWSSAVAAEKRL